MIDVYEDLRRQATRTHCRFCETKLDEHDDPVWALCAVCMAERRVFWLHEYSQDNREPATGPVKHPNRLS
jgi:hypothetical protein